jgi:ADP-ribosyl-[dinitrogen reductase] hydrolase
MTKDEGRMTKDSVVGAILGGAVGDGWGRPYEGSLPQAATVPAELIVTDDSQLTLATCEAIVEVGRIDPATIAQRFLFWFRAGRLHGLGASTLKALHALDAGAHWASSGAKGERAAGNGAAMRVAPLAFLLDLDDEGDRASLRDVCRITHHHDEAYVGALAVTVAVRLASRPGYAFSNLLSEVAGHLPDSQVRDRVARFATLTNGVSPFQVADSWGSSGFVVESVPLAIFAAREIERRPFAEVLQRAIQAGGDTDTIGSLTGQIAGAAVGASALPRELVALLHDQHEIAATAESFSRLEPRLRP